MKPARGAPELAPFGAGQRVVRLPELDNVPLTSAVAAVVDHPHFQRLRRVRQLGPTLWVYPGAVHTRFEHSLGVYGTAVRYWRSLLRHEHVAASLSEEDVRTGLMACLLHDLGHYPFAHTLEALHHRGNDAPRHEDLAEAIVFGRAPGVSREGPSVAQLLERDAGVSAARVCRLITERRADLDSPVDRLLQSVLSSALDADKMDYLWRDSVHLGVPYGRNYDRERLLNALTTVADGDGLAVSSKGIVSAEIFLFCRYTMFSEVYWHHTVRAVSAMLEAALADIIGRERPDGADLTSRLLGVGDDELLRTFAADAPPGSVAARLLHGLTGDRRRLYKRLVTWSRSYADPDKRAAYETLYQLDEAGTERLLATLRERLAPGARPLPPGSLLLDIPPRDKDRLPDVTVHHPRAGSGGGAYTRLSDSSRIVHGIAEDFVQVVKKIRLFVHPDHARLAAERERVEAVVAEAIATL